MNLKFYIKDSIQRDEKDKPFFYLGYTSNGSWTTNIGDAMKFDSEQEAIWKLEQIIKEEQGEYEIIKTYS